MAAGLFLLSILQQNWIILKLWTSRLASFEIKYWILEKKVKNIYLATGNLLFINKKTAMKVFPFHKSLRKSLILFLGELVKFKYYKKVQQTKISIFGQKKLNYFYFISKCPIITNYSFLKSNSYYYHFYNKGHVQIR